MLSEYVQQVIRSRGDDIVAKAEKDGSTWIGKVVLTKGDEEIETLATAAPQRKKSEALSAAKAIITEVRG